jgi:SAM-dependent methyltransferase
MKFVVDAGAPRRREMCPVCEAVRPYFFCTAVDRLRSIPGKLWQISRCRQCGFGWTEPLLGDDEVGGYYPPAYLGEIEHRIGEYLSGALQKSRSWRGEVEKVRLVESRLPGGRLLDVGCGDGKFLWALDPARWQRVGVEQSDAAVGLVKQRIPGINLLHGDIFHAGLQAESFDVVTLWHVLEHLADPARALRRTAELLSAGGVVIVSSPSIDSLQAALFRRHWYGLDDVPRHLHHFSRNSLNLLLGGCGLKVERHLMFSRMVNFHALKHSLVNWSSDLRAGRSIYYTLKPLLFVFQQIERITGRFGIRTVIAKKHSVDSEIGHYAASDGIRA